MAVAVVAAAVGRHRLDARRKSLVAHVVLQGPGAVQFTGYFDQTDIFFKMARSLSNDTRQIDDLVRRAAAQLRIIDQNY